MNGKHLIKSYSRTQSNIALSSAEAELYSLVSASSEGLGLAAMIKDYGRTVVPYLSVDATAAIGIAQRKGLGKLRHLDTQSLWIQDAIRQKRVHLEKVLGTENPSDLMTKHLDAASMNKCMGKLGVVVMEGRAQVAPELAQKKAKENSVNALFQDKPGKDRTRKRVAWADADEGECEDGAEVNSFEIENCGEHAMFTCGATDASTALSAGTCTSSSFWSWGSSPSCSSVKGPEERFQRRDDDEECEYGDDSTRSSTASLSGFDRTHGIPSLPLLARCLRQKCIKDSEGRQARAFLPCVFRTARDLLVQCEGRCWAQLGIRQVNEGTVDCSGSRTYWDDLTGRRTGQMEAIHNIDLGFMSSSLHWHTAQDS